MQSSIRWRLALSFATIALLAALLLGAILLTLLLQSYASRERAYLEGNAAAISSTLTQSRAAGAAPGAVNGLVEGLAFLSQARVRWLDATGAMLLDTGVPERTNVAFSGPVGLAVAPAPAPLSATVPAALPAPDVMLSLDNAPPITQAFILLDGSPAVADGSVTSGSSAPAALGPSISVVSTFDGFGLNMDASQPLARSTQVVRVALYDAAGAVTGTIELSEGPAYGRDILTTVARGWLAAGLLAVLLASLAGWLVSGRITAPIHALAQTASRMAEGDLAARVPDAGGPATAQDELGQMARAFNRMADQVESTIVTLRQFVADAAHQLHTPLTALRTNLELAAGPDDAPQNLFLARAQGQVARLTTLTDELLLLARVETGITGAASQRVDLAALVRGLAEAQAARAEQAGLAFALVAPAAPVWVMGEREQLSALADNLVDNALKFTPAGGAVTVRLAVEDDSVVLAVEDTGIGIPPDELPQLFRRFHRARNAAAIPGSGLGLAYVKAVAERHGGRVAAENRDPGARVTVTLPCCLEMV